MTSENELYETLLVLRDQLKKEMKIMTGKTPRICTDENLRDIARLRPRKLSDFNTIPGLGKAFISNFGQDFLDAVYAFSMKDGSVTQDVKMDQNMETTLQELEKKLVNISRGNKLLYLPKITSAKEAFDLEKVKEFCDPLKPLFERNKKVTLATNTNKKLERRKDHFEKLSTLQRNINRIIREKGQNDLYVGYPFVEGRFPGEKFDVKAPLVLFPVELVKSNGSIDMRFDDSRDAIFNNTLVLGLFKLNKIKKPLPDNVMDDVSREEFIDTVIDFYAQVGLRIQDESAPGDIEAYVNYLADQFPNYDPGTLFLKKNAVIGRFPTYSNSIQKDFIKIVDGKMVNPLLDELLLYVETDHKDPVSGNSFNNSFSERDLIYINDLNTAQEEAISTIKNTDSLVIQGPPGTGKSQTISNLIADFASEGNTVLLVSEKKAALDVVYSRLGKLSRYAMLIDDVNNKNLFFKQLDSMVQVIPPTDPAPNDAHNTSIEIEAKLDELERISKGFYTAGKLGVEPYRLYSINKKLDPTDKRELEKYNAYNGAFYNKMLELDFNTVNSIHDKFRRPSFVTEMNDCLDMRAQHPWMMDLKPDLNDYQVEMAKEDMLSVKSDINAWRNSGFFSKLLGKGKMKNKINDVFAKYWQYYKCHDIMGTYIDIDEYLVGMNYYDEFMTVNNAYETLTDSEKMYVDVIHKVLKTEVTSPNLINDELFNFLILQQIQKYENDNRDVIKEMSNFSMMTDELDRIISRKKDVSKSEIEHKLSAYLSAITTSKRFGEMQRVIELKRKWSVNKYIEKFDFELFKGIKIWLLTPDVVSEIVPMQSGLFDLVIFDEASQMFIEKGIPSIMRAKKVVIAGDHKQLRPSKLGAGRIGMDEDDMDEDEDMPIFEEANSLLDVSRFRYPNVMLRYHYRSKYEELIAFSNYAFYNGRLFVSPNVDEGIEPPIVVHKLDNGQWENRSNIEEAKKVVELIDNILKTRKENETIGVITFNSTQMDLIEKLLEDRCAEDQEFAALYNQEIIRKENGEDIGLFVKNIENVQGDERDIIIFSIGYAKGPNGKIVRNFGWLNQHGGENRLNVAISRSKKKIHIVTSFVPSELNVDDVKNEGPKLLKKYLQYCFAISEGSKSAAESILKGLHDDDMFTYNTEHNDRMIDEIHSMLLERGLTAEKNVGIGGYSIDVAVRKGDRYVLGIECDGKLYNNSMSTKERDYHRRKYLESRGWDIYRMWSPLWWKNPQSEVDKIVKIVESS